MTLKRPVVRGLDSQLGPYAAMRAFSKGRRLRYQGTGRWPGARVRHTVTNSLRVATIFVNGLYGTSLIGRTLYHRLEAALKVDPVFYQLDGIVIDSGPRQPRRTDP